MKHYKCSWNKEKYSASAPISNKAEGRVGYMGRRHAISFHIPQMHVLKRIYLPVSCATRIFFNLRTLCRDEQHACAQNSECNFCTVRMWSVMH